MNEPLRILAEPYIVMEGDLPIPLSELEGDYRGSYFYPIGDDAGYLIRQPRRPSSAIAPGTVITERGKALAAEIDLGGDW